MQLHFHPRPPRPTNKQTRPSFSHLLSHPIPSSPKSSHSFPSTPFRRTAMPVRQGRGSPSPVSGLVVDMFATDIIDVAQELNIPSYIYFSSTATFLSLLLHLSNLPATTEQIDFSEVEEDIRVPGLTPIPSTSMPTPLLDMKSASYKFLMYHARRYLMAKGIIINSNIRLETKSIEALAQGISQLGVEPGRTFPELYPVGPVISFGESKTQGHKCLEWLDTQPAKSVLFLCLGAWEHLKYRRSGRSRSGLNKAGIASCGLYACLAQSS